MVARAGSSNPLRRRPGIRRLSPGHTPVIRVNAITRAVIGLPTKPATTAPHSSSSTTSSPSASPCSPAAAACWPSSVSVPASARRASRSGSRVAEGVVVVVLRNLGAAAAGVGAVAVEFGFGEEAGAGAGEDAAMPFSRRARTAAMPRARALTPLLTVKPAQRSSAISLNHLDQDDKRSALSNEGKRMPLALWGGQSAKRWAVRMPRKGGQDASARGSERQRP